MQDLISSFKYQYDTIFSNSSDALDIISKSPHALEALVAFISSGKVHQQPTNLNRIDQSQWVSTDSGENAIFFERFFWMYEEKKLRMKNLISHVQAQCNTIFSEPPDIVEVLGKWKKTYQQPSNPDIIEQSQCVSTNSGEDAFLFEQSLAAYNDKKRRLKDLISYLQHQYNTIFKKSLDSLNVLKGWVSVYQQLIKPNIIL